MKEINISAKIVSNRRMKGLTQEELAAYLGVSKASVSKWETGQTYPDITLLPQIATFFNISIDELMCYEPQLTPAQVRETHDRLAGLFSKQPFDQTLDQCGETVKKYYACFPMLLKIAELYINHLNLAGSEEQMQDVLKETVRLCEKIRVESCDDSLSVQACSIEAVALMMQKKPEQVLELFGENAKVEQSANTFISQAWLMMGNRKKAVEITQISMYQMLIEFMTSIPGLLNMYGDELPKVDQLLTRAREMEKIFELDFLHPNSMAVIYLTAAQLYQAHGMKEMAYECLEAYTNIAEKFIPFSLHGDDFFDQIDLWLKEISVAPRSNESIRGSLISGVAQNPAFIPLKDEGRFKKIVNRLSNITLKEEQK